MDQTPPWPRPIAICVFRKDDRILVMEGYDSLNDEVFYRPLGGTIEFGEQARQTVEREIREEIGAEVTKLRYLGVQENLFIHEGERGHEIVLIYEGDFVDKAVYEQEAIDAVEDGGISFTALWKPLSEFREGKAPLYPEGLLDLISGRDDTNDL